MYYLDTNTVIYFLNGKFESVRENLLSTPPTEIRIPVIVKAELLAGAFGSRSKETTLAKLNLFLGHFQTVPFSDDAAEKYAEIVSTLNTIIQVFTDMKSSFLCGSGISWFKPELP